MSFQHGISGDEYIHHVHAKKVINYFTEGDKAALSDTKHLLHYYGQSFDLLAKVLINIFSIEKEYEFRHFLNSLFGFLGIFFVGLCGKLFGGYRVGTLALLACAIYPRYLAHSMNNPMDIPFAFGYIFTIYHIIKAFKYYPTIPFRHSFFISIGIAFTISIRVGGILLVPMLAFFAGLIYLDKIGLKNIYKLGLLRKYIPLVTVPILSAVAAYFLAQIVWPYALQDPLNNPFIALSEFSNIGTSIKQIFNGQHYMSDQMPWFYLPKYMLITIPLIVLIGGLAFFPLAIKKLLKLDPEYVFIAFTFLFPIVYIIYKGSNLYGGWRHLLFVYPSLAVMAGIGISGIIRIIKQDLVKKIIIGAFLIMALIPASWSVINHPHQYVYFNGLIGGTSAAVGQYELDYYYRSMREAAYWLAENEDFANRKEPILIATDKWDPVHYYLKKYPNVKVYTVKYYEKAGKDWQYGIFVNSYVDVKQVQNKLFPPAGEIYTVKAGKAPLTTVLKRVSTASFEGQKAAQQGNHQNAISLFEEYLKIDTASEETYLMAANSYLNIGNRNEAMNKVNLSLKYYPDYLPALELKGRILLTDGKFDEALAQFEQVIKIKDNYYTSYFFGAYCYANSNRIDEAIEWGIKAIEKSYGNFPDAYQLVSQLYQQKGDKTNADRYMAAYKQLKGIK